MQTYGSKYLLLLFIFCILVLLISIVGVSFAISYLDGYETVSFDSDKNLIIKYENNKNSLKPEAISSDYIPLNDDRYKIDFSLISDTNVNYKIGLVLSNPKCYSTSNIKVALLDENKNVLVGKKQDGVLKSGVVISDLNKNKKNDTNFYLFSDKITGFNNIKNYSFIAYFDEVLDYKRGIKNEKCLNNETIKLKILTDE